MDSRELVERYSAHNYHPLPVVLTQGEGAWVTDSDGKRYLDLLSAKALANSPNWSLWNARLVSVSLSS